MKNIVLSAIAFLTLAYLISCERDFTSEGETTVIGFDSLTPMHHKVNQYASFPLTTDLTQLSEKEKQMIPYLIEAAKIMDSLFWRQSYGNQDSLLNSISDNALKRFVVINYGPWDRLASNNVFLEGVDEKAQGANFYPKDMSKEEFEQAELSEKRGLYNFIKRDSNGNLITLPFHTLYASELHRAAQHLRKAAKLAEDSGLKNYLMLRANALETDDFTASDLAWLDMRNNTLDIVIGPIETYEDQLFGYKASYEAYVLVKDKEWSKRLAKYVAFLPELQNSLPVSEEYKAEKPGTDADLNAYDAIYYAGASNAGGKTIAINLPNDEKVQLEKGTRRLQLKNSMQAKFDKIMLPIAEVLITPEQQSHVTFEAFFANTMFHEVAHGLGIKNTLNNKGTVRHALKEYASALEEGKADILGLFMVEQLINKGEMEGDIEDYYTTFIAGIFRSVRFGAGEAHGQANMIRFNYFKEKEAFERLKDGTYKVNYENMHNAINSLSNLILTLQGNGDYSGVATLVADKGKIDSVLHEDLNRLKEANIPVDVVFRQGEEVLGLLE